MAAISLSSGFASEVPHRYEAGKRQMQQAFGWNVVETPNALRGPDFLYRNPRARADDLHWALSHPEIDGMVSIIGGDDSVRVLPHLDFGLIRQHPKLFMGYSDTTITLMQFLRAGVGAFYGPSVLTDFAENAGMHPYVGQGVRRALMTGGTYAFSPALEWTSQFKDWADPTLQEEKRDFETNPGWLWLQGEGQVSGHTIGGCIEVLDMLVGTPWWPEAQLWEGAILCLETSEDAPPPAQVGYWLRNYGAQGILSGIRALLLARPHRYPPEWTAQLHSWVTKVLWEYGREDLPVVANMDFGHTSPQMVMPLGAQVEVDCEACTVKLLEDALS